MRYVAKFPRPTQKPSVQVEREQQLIEHHRNEYGEEAAARYDNLNEDQKAFVDEVVEWVKGRIDIPYAPEKGTLSFLQGAAGAGKTYTVETIRKMLESDAFRIAIAATTGIAASMYERG